MNAPPVLEMKDIIKDFPGVRALNNITFTAYKGEILGLVGENGAGKSTLMKILSGVYPFGTYEGKIILDNKEVRFKNTKQAKSAGIAIIHQELNLIPQLSVAENIFLGDEPLQWGILDRFKMYNVTRTLLNRLNLDILPSETLKNLGVGKQQMVEIAKALRTKARILILDEPTSALTTREIEVLFRTLHSLKEQGVTCIYISHHLEEIFNITDRVTVIRDGATVGSAPTRELDEEKIVAMMVGREIKEMYPARSTIKGDVVLEVKDFWVAHPFRPGEKIVKDINFSLHRGEVLGVSGLMGAGRSELLAGLFGAFPSDCGGDVYLEGRKVVVKNPGQAISLGLALATEDRKLLGLILQRGVSENISLSSLKELARFYVIDKLKERRINENFVNKFKIKTATLDTPVMHLSGGNQQKIVLSRCLATQPKVLLLDEPTRGVDVGAKVEIYRIINKLLEEGLAIIMVSSSLPEVISMSDRIMVMCEGRATAILSAKETNQEEIMFYATGGGKNEGE